MKRLWDKGEPLDQRVLRYTAGEDHLLDGRLVPYDVRASIAHATMLANQKLLTTADLDAIVNGLEALETSYAAGAWEISLEDEDVHTALEARLTDAIGEAGKRVHLGRSRNDQVLAALRLYLLDSSSQLQQSAFVVAESLRTLAKRHADVGGARASSVPRIRQSRARSRGRSSRASDQAPRRDCTPADSAVGQLHQQDVWQCRGTGERESE